MSNPRVRCRAAGRITVCPIRFLEQVWLRILDDPPRAIATAMARRTIVQPAWPACPKIPDPGEKCGLAQRGLGRTHRAFLRSLCGPFLLRCHSGLLLGLPVTSLLFAHGFNPDHRVIFRLRICRSSLALPPLAGSEFADLLLSTPGHPVESARPRGAMVVLPGRRTRENPASGTRASPEGVQITTGHFCSACLRKAAKPVSSSTRIVSSGASKPRCP